MNLSLIYNKIKYFVQTEKGKPYNTSNRGIQSLILLSSMVGSMGLNFISSIITSKALGPAQYGNMKFIQTVWSLLFLLGSFGYLYSGTRLLLLEKDPEQGREITGMVLLLSVLMGIAEGLITIIIAIPVDSIFHTNLASVIIALSPLIITITMQSAMTQVLQSSNQVILLSILSIFPQLIYLISVLVVPIFIPLTVSIIMILQQGTIAIILLLIIIKIKPRITSFKYWFKRTRIENKTFGWPIYFGSIIDGTGTYINRLAISYFVDNTAVGFYSLAVNLCEPLKLIPNAVSTSAYREFADQKKVSDKLLWLTIISSLLALIAAWIFFGKPLSWIYSKEFHTVGRMARIIAISSIAWGFGDFFNRFIRAHGYGKIIRNSSYILGLINLIGLFTIVPIWGAWGVLIVLVITGITYMLYMVFNYYNIFLRKKPTKLDNLE
jgi:O-antigen/teichoic acid export membrane protein